MVPPLFTFLKPFSMYHPQQPRPPQQNPEDQLVNQLGDWVTGGKWSIYIHVYYVWIMVNHMLIAMLTRKRIGRKLFSDGLWVFAGLWLLILMIVSMHQWENMTIAGTTDGFRYSFPLFVIHAQLFFSSMFIHWVIAQITVGSRNPKYARLKHSIGESMLYLLLKKILPQRWFDDEVNARSWFKLNEERWSKYWEILLLLLIGFGFRQFGYIGYGNFLIIASCCSFNITFRAYQNLHATREAEWEAQALSEYSRKRRSGGGGGERHVIH